MTAVTPDTVWRGVLEQRLQRARAAGLAELEADTIAAIVVYDDAEVCVVGPLYPDAWAVEARRQVVAERLANDPNVVDFHFLPVPHGWKIRTTRRKETRR